MRRVSLLLSIGGAGAVALGWLTLAAPAANAMTFEDACGITHGRFNNYQTTTGAHIEECIWQDPNTGNEWSYRKPSPTLPGRVGPVGPPQVSVR